MIKADFVNNMAALTANLAGRIKLAATESANEDEFFAKLRERGVEVEKHRPDMEKLGHYTYELVDLSWYDGEVQGAVKAESYELKDGEGYGFDPMGISIISKNPSRTFFSPPWRSIMRS